MVCISGAEAEEIVRQEEIDDSPSAVIQDQTLSCCSGDYAEPFLCPLIFPVDFLIDRIGSCTADRL
jgi:hypothetical protein